MLADVEVDDIYIRKRQDTFGFRIDSKLLVNLKYDGDEVLFEVYNYLDDLNCHVTPLSFNGNELEHETKKELSLTVGSKNSIAKHLILTSNLDIEVNEENLQYLKDEITSAIRRAHLDINSTLENKYNF